jgi:hypothetical protein
VKLLKIVDSKAALVLKRCLAWGDVPVLFGHIQMHVYYWELRSGQKAGGIFDTDGRKSCRE